MNNLNNTLIIAPNIEVPITFQDIKIELIIGWKPPETIKEESILVYPIPILVDYNGRFELIQPQSTWATDIANKSFNKIKALVIEGEGNSKAINLLKNIHTNRPHFHRKEIKDQLINNKTLKIHIEEAYDISNPVSHLNKLLGCNLYCSRRINRFIANKKVSLCQKNVSTSINDTKMMDNEDQSIPKEEVSALPNDDKVINIVELSIPKEETSTSPTDVKMVDTIHQPTHEENLATPSSEKITIKDWNKFAGRTKGVWQFQTIVQKAGLDNAKVLDLINERLSQHEGNMVRVWELIYQKLGKKS